MKKFLFTLVALLTAGSAFATNEYWYMDPIELSAEDVANGATVVRPINAHFEAYVSSFMVTFYLPEGVTVTKAVRKDGLFINYFTEDGEEDTYKPSLGKNTEMTKFIVSTFTELGYTEDGECYGVLKWGPGEYQNMWEMTFQFPAGFEGGQIGILSEPSVSGDLDNRPEFIPTDGKESTHYFDVTVPEGPQPEPAPVPTLTWNEDSYTMTAACEGHDVVLMINGEAVENPYTVAQTYEEQTITFVAYTVANADESGNSTNVEQTVTVPAKAKTPSQKPVVNVEVTNDEVIITATGSGEVKLYVNGEEIAQPVRIDRPEYGQQPLEYVAKASNMDSDPNGQIQYELTWSDEVEVTVPVKEPVWQDVAAPVITTSQDDDNVYVHVEWPTTTGGRKYTGQDSYARGDQAYDVTVEAYTEENYPYRESEHATLTFTVPAKEVVPAVLEGEIVFGEVNQDNGQFTVTYTGSEDVTITLSDESILPVRDASKTYQLPAYGTYNVTATVSATGFEEKSEPATLVWEAPVTPGEGNIYVKFNGTELPVGKKIIFVYENGANSYSMGTVSTKADPVAVEVVNGEVDIEGKGVTEFTVGGGEVAYGTDIKQYTLEYSAGFLAYASSTNFKTLSSVGSYDTDAYWRLQTGDNGYVLNNAATASRYIRKHATSNKFGPYAKNADSEEVVIYIEKSETPALQDLTGNIVVSEPDENGVVTVTYDGPEEVTIMVNGEPAAESYQLEDGVPMTFNVVVTADGYNDMTANETRTWNKPQQTAKPVITSEEVEGGVNVTATGNGHICLYVEDVLVAEGEGTATYFIASTEMEEEYGVSATAQEQGKLVSDYAVETVHVPGLVPEDTHLDGVIEFSELNEENGQFTVTYTGNEAGVVITLDNEDIILVRDVAHTYKLPGYGEYTIKATASGVGYENVVEGYQTYVWEAPTTPPAAPEITINTFDDYVTLGASDVEGATVYFYQCDDETGANPRLIENPTNFNREAENYDVFVYAVAVNEAGETSSVVTKVVIPAKVVTPPDPTSINEMNGGKAVAGVRYFNMAGQEMQEANGMTIVVTTYTDGTTSAVKVMK